jgi:hypothetical protein
MLQFLKVWTVCRQDYVANEVTLDYNAGFQGAVGEYYVIAVF